MFSINSVMHHKQKEQAAAREDYKGHVEPGGGGGHGVGAPRAGLGTGLPRVTHTILRRSPGLGGR